MKPTTSDEIRQTFLEFFDELGHKIVPSSPLPVRDNPTLFFTNAGMNQFVDTFLGKEKRPYQRAVSSQKCMRVQGKHNDLENVGPSPRHHTFFEMLGNFSFGDYFKRDAIRFAHTFMTKVCQIPEGRLWYTVHKEDDEAYNFWVDDVGVPPERVLRMGDKTNFWMMGDIGPCGPTSEIHYDWGPEYCTCGLDDCSVLLDNDCGRWLEIWNLVFMQFNQDAEGVRTPLPKPGVDTGMGLERLTSVLQGTPVNYDNDLFQSAMGRIQELLGHDDAEREEHVIGYRVIADHGRASTFLIADGVLPGNVAGPYVLRMIIRRAARFGRKIGFERPFLAHIAQAYIDKMGDAYPALRQRREHILHTLTIEEEKFARVLESTLAQLDAVLDELEASGQTEIPGEDAFDLYATHGLPVEITRDVAGERGFTVDDKGFKRARHAHAEASGSGAFGRYETDQNVYTRLSRSLAADGRLPDGGVDYDPYAGAETVTEIIAILRDGLPVDEAAEGDEVELVTAATPFYVEAGGEVSDTGTVTVEAGGRFRVADVIQPVPGLVLHVGVIETGVIAVGQEARLTVDDARRADIRRNHTATHILHRELRRRLGKHVTQAGSLVAPDRLRFDFTHGEPVDRQTLAEIEAAVNETVRADRPVNVQFMSQREALEGGAMALFGEKYGDVVRTIKVGQAERPYSFELCGGLHVSRTGEIGQFLFTGEESVSAGVRRVEAVTGRAAHDYVAERLALLERIAGRLNAPAADVETRLEALQNENRALQKELEQVRRRQARSEFDALLDQMQSVDGTNLLTAVVDGADTDSLGEMADWFRDNVKSGAAVFATVRDGRPLLVATVTDDLIKRGLRAGDIIGAAARIVGGGGGGRPNFAQAGGRDAGKLPEALAAVAGIVRNVMRNE